MNHVSSFVMIFNLDDDGSNGLKATMDVPSQQAKGIPCKSVTVYDKDSIEILMPDINGKYRGRLTDVNTIAGHWTQNGMVLPLILTRTEGKVELNRPQTPLPPFNYNSEDVVFYSGNKSLYYGGTITTPKDDAKHPAIILISGSGPQNRDEEIFDHKPFAVVADYLTKRGYVVLRVDDRGVGKTGGDRLHTTTEDYANDAREAIAYLKTRKEVDKKKIGLYGHSEGGMIAQMVAADNKEVNFIVLMAAPGVKIEQLMIEQNRSVFLKGEVSKEITESYLQLYGNFLNVIVSSSTKDEVKARFYKILDRWKDTANAEAVLLTTGVKDHASRTQFVETFTEALWNKWMAYFLKYDPQPVLAKVSCKVLALNGDEDIQVIAGSNLEGIKSGLAKSKSKLYETVLVKGVNHLFQECKECTAEEYGVLEQTIKPEVLDIVGNWLDKNVSR